jgi:hypothetical protein
MNPIVRGTREKEKDSLVHGVDEISSPERAIFGWVAGKLMPELGGSRG